jgi:hypothetical protein
MKLRLTLSLALVLLGATQALSQGLPIYDNIPDPLPGNLFSQPFQAQQAEEFGDRIAFEAGTGRKLLTATQTMSSWACESGSWFMGDCVTTPGATFSHPITLNIYAVGAGNQPGALLGSVTQTFNIPFRPSADPVNCTGGRWYDGTSCFNGYATNITFDLSGLTFVAPNQVIYGIAYNTSNYGDSPLGPQPCSATPQGCPYDSLNVALTDPATSNTVGSNPAPADAYFDTLTAAWYCDGGTGGVGTFRLDAGCWTGLKPAVLFTAANVPTSANDCKNNGWKNRTTASGQTFPNQGQCIQYFNTGK